MPDAPPFEVPPSLVAPDLTRYPDGDDLRNFLDFSNLYDPTVQSQSMLIPIRAAAKRWEKRTGYTPFLADGPADVRTFHPPGNLQNSTSRRFRGGGTLLQLEAGLVGRPDFVSIDGIPLDDADWWPEPISAIEKNQPFTTIDFAYPIWGVPGSVCILGVWGYATTVPSDAWYAILLSGAAIAMYSIANDPDVAAVSEDGFTQQFDPVGALVPAIRAQSWEKFYNATLNDFRLVTM